MPSLYISAAHKSSGKTTVTLGLCRALERRGLHVQAFKKGPDYIDPIWHAQASGRACYNLDFHMMHLEEIDALFARHASSSDITLIEGNKGLYDGMDVDGGNSNAALAKRLDVPVVLVIDTQGMTRGVAPLLLGYSQFDPEVEIAGVILNKVGGPRHESKLRAVIERYTRIPVIGAMHKCPELAIVERHIGLIPANEAQTAEVRINAIADIVERQVDLDALIALGRSSPSLPATTYVADPLPDATGLRIGMADDQAFGFYYYEDRDALQASGAQLIRLDMAKDALPDLDGLILGGGFPEMFIDRLAANTAMLVAVRAAIDGGLPVYAECGGLMYLCRHLQWGEKNGAMCAVIPANVVMTERPVGRGYAVLNTLPAGFDAASGIRIPAHEFHYSRLENFPSDLNYAYSVERGQGIDGRHDGICYKNLLASYCHRRGTGTEGWIAPFLQRVRQYRLSRQENLPDT